MLNRIKAIKDLALHKLDDILQRLSRLEESTATAKDLAILTQRLDTLAETQLQNETALLEASIHILQRWENQPQRPFLLLGSSQEISAVLQLLSATHETIQSLEWEWGQAIDLSYMPDQVQVILCKLPIEPFHWDSLKKLQSQIPGSLAIFTFNLPN